MPAAVKRQSASTRSKATPAVKSGLASISSFTRTSKHVGSSNLKKDNITPAVKLAAITPASRKRKVVAATDDTDSSADETPTKKVSLTPAPVKSVESPQKRGRGRPPKKACPAPAPAPLKRARSPSVSESDASSINTDNLFKRLRLASSPLRASSPLTADTSAAESDSEPSSNLRLPSEIISLINLHSSFLKTLTLHYAHNGTNVPVDLRSLCPDIARAWGKKAVTENDIRICLGVQNMTTKLFTLSNYGRGKKCLEVDSSKVSGHLNEKLLNQDYHNKMEQLWRRFSAHGDTDTVRFTNSLPKAPIVLCDSVVKAAPVMAKGQKRLEELKQGIAIKKQEKEAKPAAATAQQQSLTNPDGSKMSLLDRIRFKQLQKASLPAGLSPAELERRAALHRAAEVTSLLGMLSRSSAGAGPMGRISFPMATVLEKLKDSFRMGISREEGAVCIRILAQEVAPEWIRVVTIGERENVVIETSRQLSKVEAERRVQAIVAKQ